MKRTFPTADGPTRTRFACLRVVLVGTVLAVPFAAHGQRQMADPMETEIWMSGTGVAMVRRFPQDLGTDHSEKQDFARSMLQTARKHADEGDWQTAEWLTKWARRLTRAPEDASNVEVVRDEEKITPRATFGVWRGVAPKPLANSAACQIRRASTFRSIAPPLDRSLVDDRAAVVLAQTKLESEPPAEPPVVAASVPPTPAAQPEMPVRPPQPMVRDRDAVHDGAAGQIALLTADIRGADLAAPSNLRPRTGSIESPVTIAAGNSAGEPALVAVISFAAGIVSCAAICLTLCFLPLRRAVDRRVATVCRPERENPAPRRRTANRPDAGNRVVEEFFDKNVELYRELARQNGVGERGPSGP